MKRARRLLAILAVMLLATFVLGPRAQQATGQDRPRAPTEAVLGQRVDWTTLRQKSLCVVFFSQQQQDLVPCLQAYQQLHDERAAANLAVIAVCIEQDKVLDLRGLLRDRKISVPVLVDQGGVMRNAYQPSAMPHAFFFAEGGRFLGDMPGFPETGYPSRQALYVNLLRRALGLEVQIDNDPGLEPWPQLPDFSLQGGAMTRQRLAGKTSVVAFVAADCDKCKAQLECFRTLHAEFKDQALQFVVVLVSDEVDPQTFQGERKLPFPVYRDPDGKARLALKYRGLVPDTMVVDADLHIRYRHTVFTDEEPPLYRMQLRRLLGLPNAPILKSGGPSGVRRCAVCHEREYFDWLQSGHAHAMRSLQAIGKAEDADCVRCHVVGWQQPGGYDSDRGARAALLQDVQCESCHGNGGPHLPGSTPGTPTAAATCTPCHDPEHSLHFDFEPFRALVDHRSDLLHSTPAQRDALRQQRQRARQALLEPQGAYVGAAACRECHAAQYAAWQQSPHEQALQRLSPAQQQQADCVRCHVTGFGRSWASGTAPAPADPLGRGVQCEACHGPGQQHLAAATPAAQRASITGLGARCEQCVIRQICCTCHDRANDPDFDLARALPPMQQRCRPKPGR